MSRWLLLAAWSLVPCVAGCGSSMRAGLANAPKLGSTGDEQVHDAIANGDDGCARNGGPSVLRSRVPPCPAPAQPGARSAWMPSAARSSTEGGLVVPWLNHFYVGWPCGQRTDLQPPKKVAWDFSGTSTSAIACGIEER